MTAYVTENPATGDVEQTFATMSDDDVNDVLARSAAAYQEWRHTAVEDRVAMLRATAQAYRDRADELAALISKEMGKPLAQAHGELEARDVDAAMRYVHAATGGNRDDAVPGAS